MRFLIFLFLILNNMVSIGAQTWTVVLEPRFIFAKTGTNDEINLEISLIDVQGNDQFNDVGVDGVQVTQLEKVNSVSSTYQDQLRLEHDGNLYDLTFDGDTVLISLADRSDSKRVDLAFHQNLEVISLNDLKDSTVIDLQDAKGNYDYVIVSVWSIRCAPCIEKLPLFREYSEITKHRVLFIHVCPDKETDAARSLLNKEQPPGIYAWSNLNHLKQANLNRGFPAVNLYDGNLDLVRCFNDVEDVFNYLTLLRK